MSDGFAAQLRKDYNNRAGESPLVLIGRMVVGNLYQVPPTLKNVLSCPVLLILTRSSVVAACSSELAEC